MLVILNQPCTSRSSNFAIACYLMVQQLPVVNFLKAAMNFIPCVISMNLLKINTKF